MFELWRFSSIKRVKQQWVPFLSPIFQAGKLLTHYILVRSNIVQRHFHSLLPVGLARESNPGPRVPETRIIPLDQRANKLEKGEIFDFIVYVLQSSEMWSVCRTRLHHHRQLSWQSGRLQMVINRYLQVAGSNPARWSFTLHSLLFAYGVVAVKQRCPEWDSNPRPHSWTRMLLCRKDFAS